jgi:hypothetical protein
MHKGFADPAKGSDRAGCRYRLCRLDSLDASVLRDNDKFIAPNLDVCLLALIHRDGKGLSSGRCLRVTENINSWCDSQSKELVGAYYREPVCNAADLVDRATLTGAWLTIEPNRCSLCGC